MDVKGSIFITAVLPAVIAAIMFGLGLALQKADFIRVLKEPKATLAGLGLKILLLPAIAFGLSHLFKLSSEFSVGLVMLAAAPSSAVANVFSRLTKGDVALSLCITAVDNIITAVTLPLYVALAFHYFAGASKEIGLQWAETLKIFSIILFPVLAGMLFRSRFPAATVRVDKILRIVSIVALVLLIVGVVAANRNLFVTYFAQLGAVVLTFNLICFALGYGFPKVLGISKPQSTSIAMASGIQATALVVTISLSFLNEPAYGMPAAFFSLTMYLIAFTSIPILKRLS